MQTDLFGRQVKNRGTLDEHCSRCGHATRLYRFTFDQNSATALQWFASAPGPDVSWDRLPDYYSGFQKANLQSQTTILSYLGLLEKVIGDYGKQVPKTWRLTELGRQVAREWAKCPQWVWTYEGEVYPKGDNPPMITMADAKCIRTHRAVDDYEVAGEGVFEWFRDKLEERYGKKQA